MSNPVRQQRIVMRLSQKELADLAGMHRSTLQAIEEGTTTTPSDASLAALAAPLQTSVDVLRRELQGWWGRRGARLRISPAAKALLDLPAEALPREVQSFAQWRRRIHPTASGFATLVGMNRGTITQYESGVRTRGPSHRMMTLIGERLNLGAAYLEALSDLPPSVED